MKSNLNKITDKENENSTQLYFHVTSLPGSGAILMLIVTNNTNLRFEFLQSLIF